MKNLGGMLAVAMLAACGGMDPSGGEAAIPREEGTAPTETLVTESSALTCGSGTKVENDQCVPLQQALRCGAGTVLVGDECQSDPSVCVAPPTNGTLASLLGSTGTRSAILPRDNSRFIFTTLSQSTAEAWVDIGAKPVGTGVALHISGSDIGFDVNSSNSDRVMAVVDDTSSVGKCRASASPDMSQVPGLHVSLVQWKGGAAQILECARAGAVRYQFVYDGCAAAGTTVPCIKATLNLAFGDGSTILEDKVLYVAYR